MIGEGMYNTLKTDGSPVGGLPSCEGAACMVWGGRHLICCHGV